MKSYSRYIQECSKKYNRIIPEPSLTSTDNHAPSSSSLSPALHNMLRIDTQSNKKGHNYDLSLDSDEESDELYSSSEIMSLLGLFSAILEVGSSQRSEAEETVIRLTVEPLLQLSLTLKSSSPPPLSQPLQLADEKQEDRADLIESVESTLKLLIERSSRQHSSTSTQSEPTLTISTSTAKHSEVKAIITDIKARYFPISGSEYTSSPSDRVYGLYRLQQALQKYNKVSSTYIYLCIYLLCISNIHITCITCIYIAEYCRQG